MASAHVTVPHKRPADPHGDRIGAKRAAIDAVTKIVRAYGAHAVQLYALFPEVPRGVLSIAIAHTLADPATKRVSDLMDVARAASARTWRPLSHTPDLWSEALDAQLVDRVVDVGFGAWRAIAEAPPFTEALRSKFTSEHVAPLDETFWSAAACFLQQRFEDVVAHLQTPEDVLRRAADAAVRSHLVATARAELTMARTTRVSEAPLVLRREVVVDGRSVPVDVSVVVNVRVAETLTV